MDFNLWTLTYGLYPMDFNVLYHTISILYAYIIMAHTNINTCLCVHTHTRTHTRTDNNAHANTIKRNTPPPPPPPPTPTCLTFLLDRAAVVSASSPPEGSSDGRSHATEPPPAQRHVHLRCKHGAEDTRLTLLASPPAEVALSHLGGRDRGRGWG